MTSSLKESFARAERENRAAFIPYVTGGFPDAETCLKLIQTLDESGADIIEVGVPFSDPLADGPAIQRASKIALEKGATPFTVLAMVSQAAGLIKAPLVLMTYYNPVLKMGLDAFAQKARQAKAAGVIIPDLPPEEAGPWVRAARQAELDTIFLAAPTTTPERLARIKDLSRGFLYYVSLTGVTGSDLAMGGELLANIASVRKNSPVPVAVGFGVSRPGQAAILAKAADGVIVGSALVKKMLEEKNQADGIQAMGLLANELRDSLRRNP